MNGQLLTLLMALSFLGGCVATEPVFSGNFMRPSDVAREARTLEGKIVSLSGYLILEDEAHALWDSKSDADEVVRRGASGGDPIWNRCIAIYFTPKLARSLQIPIRENIEVTGTIGITDRKKDGVDLWACNDIYITARSLVRKQENRPAS